MRKGVVLTEEKAAEAGITGPGPFTFAGAFPGIYEVGAPVAVAELGFGSEDEALGALEESGAPLDVVSIGDDEGLPRRVNHGLSLDQARAADAALEETGPIRTHAQADAVAGELGIGWGDRKLTVDEKVEAIERVRAGEPAFDEGEGS